MFYFPIEVFFPKKNSQIYETYHANCDYFQILIVYTILLFTHFQDMQNLFSGSSITFEGITANVKDLLKFLYHFTTLLYIKRFHWLKTQSK
jgi:hypothetical protein